MANDKANLEQELVPRLVLGDDGAYAMLYDHYAPMLYGIILKVVGDQADAGNLLQDCFVKIWNNIERFDPTKGRFATWLINIARNTAIDYTRSKHFLQKQANQNLENFVGLGEGNAFQTRVDTLGLRQLVENLSPPCREVIEWMYFEGYTQQEIADQFGIPLGTVKSRTRLALKALRAYFFEQ